MAQASLPQPHEQRKVEELLLKLSKMNPVTAKPGMVSRKSTIGTALTASPRVFFST